MTRKGGGRKRTGTKRRATKRPAAKRGRAKAAGGRAGTRGGPAAATPARRARPPHRPPAVAVDGREWHALQRSTRQSPYKMRLVIDEIRGRSVNDALAYLAFSKKHAAKQIEKVLRSAVANAEYRTRDDDRGVDVDELYVKRAVINEGPKLKRYTPAAMGRATPIIKRTSHVEIVVAQRGQR
jgi:large subunit ribosomal protein L22